MNAADRSGTPLPRQAAVIGIVGMGYVGMPLALTASAAGFRVVGFDIDPHKVAEINAGRSYIKHIAGADVAAAVKAGRLRATTNFAEVKRRRRHHHLRADAADRAPRAGPELCRTDDRSDRAPSAQGSSGRAGIDDLARHDRRK